MTISCQNVTITATGSLAINSTPTGAEIWLVPHPAGTYIDQGVPTNTTISGVTIGTYDVKLVKSGYQDWIDATGTITVTSGSTTTVNATLTSSTGSVTITSSPSGADIWIGPHLGTLIDQQITTTQTISDLAPGSYDYKLTLAGYTDATGTFSITPATNTSFNVNLLTTANITATNVTITPSQTPCITGICSVTVVVRWSNSGQTNGTVIPNIKIDNITQTPHSSRIVNADSYVEETFIITGLSAAIHTICPYPN